MTPDSDSLDRFACGPIAPLLAFLWGLTEATLFFIVPDVLLSVIGCRSARAGIKATGLAVIGALIGGAIMYFAGYRAPERSHSMLVQVPAIDSTMVERVQSQVSDRGTMAILFGPAVGIPYKIYAVEWGSRRENLLPFLLVSIPARGFRFLLTVVVTSGVARLLARWTHRRAKAELAILALFWITFYSFYFSYFGW